ncbi:MAG: hypothetical protein P4N60_13710 [Verrucomicrobiae bacterium]|nr:hypothetical protein [Verrucomicrobiae bacterium]
MTRPLAILLLLPIIGVTLVAQNAALLSWTSSSNRLVNSSYVIAQRVDAGIIQPLNTTSNSYVFTADNLAFGLNRLSVAQMDTNAAGTVQLTPFSGEVWVQKIAVVQVDPVITNFVLEATTNLALSNSWRQVIGTQSFTFPTAEQQQYFRGKLDFYLRSTRTNQLAFPPSP